MNKHLGQVKEATIKLDSPLKFETKAMNFSEIMILIGTNGSGKSLILKLTWCMSYISEVFIANKKVSGFNLIELAQFVFDKSFEDQNFNGDILYVFDNKNSIEIKIEKGKVTTVNPCFEEDLEFSGFPCFMSTETRLYSDIKKYLILRKSFGLKGLIDISNAANLNKLLDIYRLYDVVFCETLIGKLQKPLILSSQVQDSLHDKFQISKKIVSIGLDENKSELYYVDTEGSIGSLTTLSNGEQALINMIITANS